MGHASFTVISAQVCAQSVPVTKSDFVLHYISIVCRSTIVTPVAVRTEDVCRWSALLENVACRTEHLQYLSFTLFHVSLGLMHAIRSTFAPELQSHTLTASCPGVAPLAMPHSSVTARWRTEHLYRCALSPRTRSCIRHASLTWD